MTKTLHLAEYAPNWANKRVRERADAVLSWAELMLHPERPTPVSAERLRVIFGHEQASKLAQYLRANLLIQTGTYEPGIRTYDYLLNQRGMMKVKNEISSSSIAYVGNSRVSNTNISTNTSNNTHTAYVGNSRVSNSPRAPQYYVEHSQELATLDFKYNLKSNRYWHPLQNIKRDQKNTFWAKYGLPYNYDIDACAPTILLGLAKKHGLNELVAQPITDYLKNKGRMRRRIATLLDIDADTAKRIINSLFNGARLAATPFCATCRLIGKEKTHLLQQDAEIKLLRTAIKALWRRIQMKTGRDLSSSKGKWGLYFTWEKIVLDIIKQELTKQDAKFFTEHDGFRTNKEINLMPIQEEIYNKTGLEIAITIQQQLMLNTPSK